MATKKRASKKSEAIKYLDSLIREPMSLGHYIRTIRQCDEITQAELAQRLGVTKAYICDIEKGRKTVSPARAAAIARMLGYSDRMFIQLALQDQLSTAELDFKVVLEAA